MAFHLIADTLFVTGLTKLSQIVGLAVRVCGLCRYAGMRAHTLLHAIILFGVLVKDRVYAC